MKCIKVYNTYIMLIKKERMRCAHIVIDHRYTETETSSFVFYIHISDIDYITIFVHAYSLARFIILMGFFLDIIYF